MTNKIYQTRRKPDQKCLDILAKCNKYFADNPIPPAYRQKPALKINYDPMFGMPPSQAIQYLKNMYEGGK